MQIMVFILDQNKIKLVLEAQHFRQMELPLVQLMGRRA
jgi:hypothetical protein